ncbi:MAG TPA: DUF1080 domain-containing protein [Gemmatimonadaceae bacterium]|nr:DUF1080 domain-containing protein [Gemmatimonadaceae bacterium]
MTRYASLAALVILTAPSSPGSAAREAVVGRWDITIQKGTSTAPSWLEIRPSGRAMLVGRFVGEVGSSRPVSRIDFTNGAIRFAIPPQWETGENDLTLAGTLQGDQLSGTITYPDGRQFSWTGKRAPALRRTSPPQWGPAIRLFNGTDVAGWRVLGGENRWQGVNGVLRNTASGGNLVTERSFGDFKLHLEFRYPKGSNSGVYLRGRYEVQIADSVPPEPVNDLLGSVYGFLSPSEIANRKPDEWQSYDITLLGRMVTIVLNGKTVISNQAIPGITGGALDSDEGAPGPLMLQGDHGVVEYRNIVLTPAKN